MGLFLSAEVGVLLCEHHQPLFQPGIEGVDACRVLSLVEQNLSEKYYYPRNCNESMRIKGCFIDFLG
jgi:hypothetical protein